MEKTTRTRGADATPQGTREQAVKDTTNGAKLPKTGLCNQ